MFVSVPPVEDMEMFCNRYFVYLQMGEDVADGDRTGFCTGNRCTNERGISNPLGSNEIFENGENKGEGGIFF